MTSEKETRITLSLPPLDTPTAAWILDLCGHLQAALLRSYGDELETYWTATEPAQPIYGPLKPPQRKKAAKR